MKKGITLLSNIISQVSTSKLEKYQGMTGSIIFSIIEMRPDITFATSIVGCFTKNPSHQYTEAIKTILRYLKGSQNQGITYEGKEELCIEGYLDSN